MKEVGTKLLSPEEAAINWPLFNSIDILLSVDDSINQTNITNAALDILELNRPIGHTKKYILIERFYPNYDNCSDIMEEEVYRKFLKKEMATSDAKWIIGNVIDVHVELLKNIWEKTFDAIMELNCTPFGYNALDSEIISTYGDEKLVGESNQLRFDNAMKNIFSLINRERKTNFQIISSTSEKMICLKCNTKI
jgi:hypothetical protein